MRALILLPMLAACGEQVTPEEQARRDAADVAEVRANQVPPAIPAKLEPIRYPEIEKNEIYGIGCSFVPHGGGMGAVAIAMQDAAYVMPDSSVMRLAPDAGSDEGPFGTRTKYDGRKFSLQLETSGKEGEQVGMETIEYDARLTLRDERDRVVYAKEGYAQCGS